MSTLKKGSKNDAVRRLQADLCLRDFDAKPIDGAFGSGTETALRAFQVAQGLTATGVANPKTRKTLGLDGPDPTERPEPVIEHVTPDRVAQMFSRFTPKHLPHVCEALKAAGMDDLDLVLMALGSIRAETEGFEPIDEGQSKFNTDPGSHPFNRYDHRLGNRGRGEGARFKGRGFIQLTGRENYEKLSTAFRKYTNVLKLNSTHTYDMLRHLGAMHASNQPLSHHARPRGGVRIAAAGHQIYVALLSSGPGQDDPARRTGAA